MSWFSKIAAMLKFSQAKPGPASSISGDYEMEQVLNPERHDRDVLTHPFTSKPENLVGDIWDTTKENADTVEDELEDAREESSQSKNKYFPFQTDLNKERTIHNIPQDNPNLKQIRVRPILDIHEIDKLNRNIAMKMRKVGVVHVDKEIFMTEYNKLVRRAILEKRPISEILHEIF